MFLNELLLWMLQNHNKMHITLTILLKVYPKQKKQTKKTIHTVCLCLQRFQSRFLQWLHYIRLIIRRGPSLLEIPLIWNHLKSWLSLIWCLRTSASLKENNWNPVNRRKHSSSKTLRDQYSLRYASFSKKCRLLSSMLLWVFWVFVGTLRFVRSPLGCLELLWIP